MGHAARQTLKKPKEKKDHPKNIYTSKPSASKMYEFVLDKKIMIDSYYSLQIDTSNNKKIINH